jgi:hypothetical protein
MLNDNDIKNIVNIIDYQIDYRDVKNIVSTLNCYPILLFPNHISNPFKVEFYKKVKVIKYE